MKQASARMELCRRRAPERSQLHRTMSGRLLLAVFVLSAVSHVTCFPFLSRSEIDWGVVQSKLMQSNRFWHFLGYSFLMGLPRNFNRMLRESNDTFTFLAPTDTAFESLNQEVTKGMKNNHTILTHILKTHVLRGRFPASQLLVDDLGQMYPTLLPGKILHKLQSTVPGKVQLGFAVSSAAKERVTVIQSNLLARPRILIHAVNKVLVPSDLQFLSSSE